VTSSLETTNPLQTIEVESVDWIKGVAVPRGVHFRQLIFTGPPGSGKSNLIQNLGGWPEEGCIDLALKHWWRNRLLAFQPREVHFSIPFHGFDNSRTVFDPEWLAAPAPVGSGRIQILPLRKWFFQVDWRARFVFDFQLPTAEQIYIKRTARAEEHSHKVDRKFELEDIERQCAVYVFLARYFHHNGMKVIVRTEFGGMPRTITETQDFPSPNTE
jgi:hypothetical protein